MSQATAFGGAGGDDWVSFRVFYERAKARGWKFMRRQGSWAVFVDPRTGRVFMVEVVNGMIRREDFDDFDLFSYQLGE